ncbi:hypothetical protein TSAR_009938 [Trichomalopsis sarcophagae]|uniref:Uncharacterized protein n=1 Tax=Trichomalopsis sarcophagae TaxID=543379 RepID=A0A232EHF7_9HYME|nr:hypothetical protein TSAR_009938 [Trichomalopsis sarcophagae]
MGIWMIEKETEEKKEKRSGEKSSRLRTRRLENLKKIERLEKKSTDIDTQERKMKETTVEEVEEESERDKKERKRHKKSLFIRKVLYWRQIENEWWTENMLKIDFDEAKGRKKLRKWRRVAKEENCYVLDEWLSLKEREDRFHLVKIARELDEKKTEKGEKIKSRKKGELKKISEKEADEEPVIEN